MSKSGSRAGGREKEKEKNKPSHVSQPVIIDIVPGKITENDWAAMLEKDSSEDFVFDFIEEILAQTMDTIYKQFIISQKIPFTVQQAAEEMLQIVEWLFIDRDEGEPSIEESSGWDQDEEPKAAVMDCWAQGAVPRTEVTISLLFPEEAEEEETSETSDVIKKEETGTPVQVEPDNLVSVAAAEQEEEQEPAKVMASKKKPKPKHKIRRPHLKPVPVLDVKESPQLPQKDMTVEEMPSLMGTRSNISGVAKSPSTQGDERMSEKAKHVSVAVNKDDDALSFMKLDPDTLPNYRYAPRMFVTLKFQLLEKTQISMSKKVTSQSGPSLAHQKRHLTKKQKDSSGGKSVTKPKTFIPLQNTPSLLDTINLEPGVTVFKGGHTKRAPKSNERVKKRATTEGREVRTMSSILKDRSNTFSVCDILGANNLTIRPLEGSSPLPPIQPTCDDAACTT
ncbi:uncharacterized protein LOC143292229 [Babylonia areolata]|uniref:uncharacterized protein LOC143292229 n=1 Tax=Babylonia areolata TaxID=304850 RepID=UPI003FD26CEA